MKKFFFFILFILQVVSLSSHPLDSLRNSFRANDFLTRYQLPCVLSFDSGVGALWNLSGLETSGSGRLKVYANTDTLNKISVSNGETSFCFRQNNDTLFYSGFENNLAMISYQADIPVMTYSMQYGDSVVFFYTGNGCYSDDWLLESVGHGMSKFDAVGTLITPDADTLVNVVRVHLVRNSRYSIVAKGEVNADPSSIIVCEDDYLWYAPGYRYPVLHANIYTEEGNSESSLWYTPLYEQESLAVDDENLAIRQTGSDGSAIDETGEGGAESPLHYTLRNNPGEKRVTVFYDQGVAGTVTFILSDVRGTVYSSRNQTHDAGTGYSAEISLAGLRSGSYVLYICMDNQRYAETVLVK